MARRMSPVVGGRGFTLIELMVAVAIMALMALMGWRALDGMQSAVTGNQRHADAVLGLDAGLAQWTIDLDSVATVPHTLAFEFDGRALYLTRHAQSGAAAGLQIVAWRRAERAGQAQWLRWQSLPVRTRETWSRAWADAHAWAQGAQSASDDAVGIVALDAWQLYFYRDGAWSNPLSSAGNKAGVAASVPDGVRLVLTVAAGHPLAGPITRDWARTVVVDTP